MGYKNHISHTKVFIEGNTSEGELNENVDLFFRGSYVKHESLEWDRYEFECDEGIYSSEMDDDVYYLAFFVYKNKEGMEKYSLHVAYSEDWDVMEELDYLLTADMVENILCMVTEHPESNNPDWNCYSAMKEDFDKRHGEGNW